MRLLPATAILIFLVAAQAAALKQPAPASPENESLEMLSSILQIGKALGGAGAEAVQQLDMSCPENSSRFLCPPRIKLSQQILIISLVILIAVISIALMVIWYFRSHLS